MDNKISIAIVVLIVFVTSSVLIYSYLQNFYELTISEQKYENLISQVNPEKKKIVIIGASSVAMLNVTHIDENLAESGWSNFEVYKLTRDGDRPTKRILDIDELFVLEPDIVIYGLGTREFGYNLFSPGLTQCIPINQYSLRELEDSLQEGKQDDSEFFQNLASKGYFDSFDVYRSQISRLVTGGFNHLEEPKLVTVFYLDKMFSSNSTETISDELTKPINLKEQGGVAESRSTDSLKKESAGLVMGYCNTIQEEEFESLTEIIQRLQEKNIQVVLFSAPYSGPFLEKLSEIGLRHYFLALQDLADKNKVHVYSFLDRYSDKEIFYDLTHVSKTVEGNIFSDDFSEFTVGVIEDYEQEHKNPQIHLAKFSYNEGSGGNWQNTDFHGETLSDYSFKNSNLKNVDFSGMNLSGLDMRFSNLEGANLSNTILNGTNLQGANIGFSNLSGSDLTHTNLSGANLGLTNLQGVQISNTDLSYSIAFNVPFENIIISDSSFAGANMFQSNFSDSSLKNVDFSNADLSLSDFSGTKFDNVLFRGSKLINSDFSNTDLSGLDFSRSELDGANFTNSILRFGIFEMSQLPTVNLSGLNLESTRLAAINLYQSNLENTNITNSKASHALLENANLVKADLSNSDFSAANFVNANLTGANLTHTNLRFANFTGAILNGADLRCFDNPICN